MPESRYYAAFASYASRWDARLTGDVERFLEGFHANDLVPPEYRRRIEVCRDSSDFPLRARLSRSFVDAASSPGLRDVIRGLLKVSEHLVVFVRPESASHSWIAQEIELWLEMRGPEGIVVCLADGDERMDPRALFPGRLVDHGIHEQVHVDLRGFRRRGDDRYAGRSYDEELLRLAALLLGSDVAPSALIAGWRTRARERAAREARERLTRNVVVAGTMVALVGVGGYLVQGAYRRTTGVELAGAARAAAAAADGLRMALEAYPDAPDAALPVIQAAAGRLAGLELEHRQPADGRYWDIPAPRRPAPELMFGSGGGLVLARRDSMPLVLGPGRDDARPVPGWNAIPERLRGWRPMAVSPSRRFLAGMNATSVRVVERSPEASAAGPPSDFVPPRGFVPTELAVSDDGSAVAGLDEDGRLWGAPVAATTSCPFLPPGAVDRERLLVAPGARIVATAYQVPCGRSTCRRVLAIRPSGCETVFDGRYDEGDVRALTLAAGKEPRLIVGMRAEIRTISLGATALERSTPLAGDRSLQVTSPDGRFVAAAGPSGDVSVIALDELREAAVVPGYDGNETIAFSRDGTTLAVAGYERGDGRRPAAYVTSVSRLDVVTGYGRARWSRDAAGGPLDWVRGGSGLAVAGLEGAVLVDPSTGAPGTRLTPPPCLSGEASIQDMNGRAPDGTLVALYMPGTLVRWRLDDGRAECVPVGGRAGRARQVRLVDGEGLVGIVGGRLIGLPGPDGGPACPDVPISLQSRIAVSRRGRMLAWVDAGPQNVEVGRRVSARIVALTGCASASVSGWLPQKVARDTRSVRGLALDDAGGRIGMLVGEGERTYVLVWTRRSCRSPARCPSSWDAPIVVETGKRFDELAISPDGRYLAVRGTGTVEVRDLKRGIWLYGFDIGHADAMTSENTLSFSPDGRFLAASFPSAAPLIRVVDEAGLVRDACLRLPPGVRPTPACEPSNGR